MSLSRRLQAVSGLVKPCAAAADIGTDHAFVPVDLITRKTAQRVIAMDVNAGPLGRAEETIRNAGLSAQIETRLSDGMEKLEPGEADATVIAGMGGALTVRILSARPEVTASLSQLILQPQSEIFKVRLCLRGFGFVITAEDMVLEDGKYYPMMRAERTAARELPELTQAEAWYGPLLLAGRHPVLRSYLEKELGVRMKIREGLAGSRSDTAAARAREVEADLARLRTAMAFYES